MLRLENIIKNYQTGKTTFPALKGISLAFRKNEFVSILGPSGCGKTTLLNIIGGLDHYTTGDLVIEGKSTKEYKDRDWDLYRNHRIGFIFQSYNLIPHQNILENVELALTIAGYSKEEKKKKALKALSMVGLKKAWKKMPNQLSGGQCQRVAIARALVNEPDILLGDEPTGALDSKTSVQVMELIKKISKKKLVIMVTHNPPLAEQYSTRIISLLDGEVQKDTNPYKLSDEKQEKFKKVETIKVGNKSIVKADKAKMSFWDAFKLSAKNLISKKKRTAMVIAASSIGIVGVASVLAVSTGVRGFISNTQKDMLSSSPLTASETTFDLVSILQNVSTTLQRQAVSQSIQNGYIDIEYLTGTLINQAKQGVVITNDITDNYVSYIKEGQTKMPEISDVFYNYDLDISNNIYTNAKILSRKNETTVEIKDRVYSLSGLKNIYTALLGNIKTEEKVDFTPLANIAANFPSIMYQGLDNTDYLKEQYDLVTKDSKWPSKITGENAGTHDNPYQCVVVLNKRKKLIDLVVALSGMLSEEDFMRAIMQFISEQPDEQLIEKLSKILLTDVMNKSFYYVPNGKVGQEGAYHYNSKSEEKNSHPYEYNYYFDKDTTASSVEFLKPHGGLNIKIASDDSNTTTAKEIKVVGLISPKEGRNYGSLSSGIYFLSDLSEKIMIDSGQSVKKGDSTYDTDSDLYRSMIDIDKWVTSSSGNGIWGMLGGKYETSVTVTTEGDLSTEDINYGLYYPLQFIGIDKFDESGNPKYFDIKTYGTVGGSAKITSNYKPDGTLLSNTITSSLNSRELAGRKTKYVGGNDKYNFNKLPFSIRLYSRDFQSKDVVKAYLDEWNGNKTITIHDDTGKEITLLPKERSKVIVPDNLTIVISMINGLINTTTISLTIFASLSLVVSSVMIGIITYISVMERIKEIGVIRSLGGRKKDVSHLFNAETFILGTAAGVFGILITYIFELILDITIYATYKIPMIANLKWWTALIMVILSIVLTAVSGLIPSRSAAKKDPVTALRSE